MATFGGRIDFMFLGPSTTRPLDQLMAKFCLCGIGVDPAFQVGIKNPLGKAGDPIFSQNIPI